MNPDFSCCNSFALSWVDKVTTGTWSFVSVIASVFAWFTAALDITQFAGQVAMRLISQLVNGSSRVLQKLLIYFSGTSISTFFVPSSPVKPIIFCLNLNEVLLPGKLAILPAAVKAGLSL